MIIVKKQKSWFIIVWDFISYFLRTSLIRAWFLIFFKAIMYKNKVCKCYKLFLISVFSPLSVHYVLKWKKILFLDFETSITAELSNDVTEEFDNLNINNVSVWTLLINISAFDVRSEMIASRVCVDCVMNWRALQLSPM